MKRNRLLSICAACMAVLPALAFDPPTMGWSSWNTFALNINEQVIKSQADAMVSTGLSKAGYKFINIDKCSIIKNIFISLIKINI